MDHQQNFEFNDPNSFGFISSFSGSDNFMLAQPQQEQQQLNGKDHSLPSTLPALTTSFDPGSAVPSQFVTQSAHIMYDLPEAAATPQQPIVHYPNAISYLNMTPVQPEMSINSQKDSLFNLESPSAVVPANIIQQNEPEIVLSSSTDVIQASLHPTEPLISTDEPALKETENSEITDEQQLQTETIPEAEITEKPVPIAVSPEQRNMMKALGVVRKEALASVGGSRKRRRRILQLNEDDSDDENELKKELSQISPEKDKEKTQDDNETEDSTPDSDSDDPSVDPSALKVRSLLKSAVIIQGPRSKKKKKRVLESDDEDETMQTSVDDIGLMESNEIENDEELFNNDIIVSEAAFGTIDGNEKLISIESPLISQDEFAVTSSPAPMTNEPAVPEIGEKSPEIQTEVSKSTPAIVKGEKEETGPIKVEGPKSTIKSEDGETDPSLSVEAILEKIKPMADDE